ncbi:hypothetical protein [Celerinatantimonas sp. YJH-8]|uniref:hypothetical protein n=1 Tax=Celerinatantimonas sp. YJH-8 TaxID=3228714 RepID=UPI0038C5D189
MNRFISFVLFMMTFCLTSIVIAFFFVLMLGIVAYRKLFVRPEPQTYKPGRIFDGEFEVKHDQ